MTIEMIAPETKATGPVAEAYDALARTFSAFRETNDERLAQIERRMASDAVTEEKLIRLDQAVDGALRNVEALSLKARRPSLGAELRETTGANEHKSAFNAYVRGGETDALLRFEQKSMSGLSGPDGGYLVPQIIEREILRRMAALSPIRAIASVRPVSTGIFKKAYAADGITAGWSDANAVIASQNQQLSDIVFPTFELYAQPAATKTLLDDETVDVERWIADEVEIAFAEQEGAAFVTGNGTDRPKGFLSVPQVANTGWSWGNLGTVSTGAAGAFPATDASDKLVDLVYALKAGYRQNGTFVMNRKTQSAIRKLKDAEGRYIWAPPAVAGAGATLMGFPVIEAEDMPDIAADTTAVAFGDFRRGYLVLDRTGIRILRDPFSAKPYVQFYCTKRVGGGVQDYAAIKLLKFSA